MIKLPGKPVAFYVLDNGDLMPLYPPAQAIPEGWRLVPEEPTDRMLGAAWNCAKDGTHCTHGMIYEAMLAAAPSYQGDKP